MKSAKLIALSLLSSSVAFAAPNLRSGEYRVTGDITLNSLNQTTTLGSGGFKLQAKGGQVKLECGILGNLVGYNQDGSLNFRHTLACDDHSVFVLNTHTVVTPQSTCPARPGAIVGTFHEESDILGVDGPFAGSSGLVSIDGSINCGFNDMQARGTLTLP